MRQPPFGLRYLPEALAGVQHPVNVGTRVQFYS